MAQREGERSPNASVGGPDARVGFAFLHDICEEVSVATGLAVEIVDRKDQPVARSQGGAGNPEIGARREIPRGWVRVGVPSASEFDRAQAAADLVAALLAREESPRAEVTEVARRVVRIGDRARVFHRLNATLSAAVSPTEVASTVLDRVLDVVPARRASVMLENETAETLDVVVARGLPADIDGKAFRKPGDWVAGRVLRQGEPILVEDAASDPDLRKLRTEGSYTTGSFMCVPIPSDPADALPHHPAMGVINLADPPDGRPFTYEDLDIVTAVASQAARVLHHVHLRQRHRDQSATLQETIERLRHTERMSAIGEFAAAVIHELKSPLTSILGYATLIRGTEKVGDRVTRFTELIEEGAARIRSITDELLTYAGHVGERTATDLRVMVDEALLFVRHRTARLPGIAIERRFADDLPCPVIDRPRVQMIVQNLVANAVDAIDGVGGKGSIHVAIDTAASADLPASLQHQAAPAAKAAAGAAPSREWTRITVTDTGPGVAERVRERLFHYVLTTKTHGTGLGLPLSRQIARGHGGDLVLLTSDKGARFGLYIPVEQAPHGAWHGPSAEDSFVHLPGPLAILDQELTVRRTTESFRRLLSEGDPPPTLVDRPLAAVIGVDPTAVAAALAGGPVAGGRVVCHLAPLPSGEVLVLASRDRRLVDLERVAILSTLLSCGGNKSEAARRLGIGKSTLYRKLKGFQGGGSPDE